MDDPRDPPLRDVPPGLYYASHTVAARPDLVIGSPIMESRQRKVRGALSDDFDDPSMMYEFFATVDPEAIPSKDPSLILTCQRIERKESRISKAGFEVHTFVLPSATLSLPEHTTNLPGFARVHAILQLVTDCEDGELLTVDSLARIEDGVRRTQTWGYVKEGRSIRVHQHWNELEDEGANQLRSYNNVKCAMDMYCSVRQESTLRDRMVAQGERERERLSAETKQRRANLDAACESAPANDSQDRSEIEAQRSEEISFEQQLGEVIRRSDKITLTDDSPTAPIPEMPEPSAEDFVEVEVSVAEPPTIDIPHSSRVPSPLRQSFVVVHNDDEPSGAVGYLAPSVQQREKTPPTANPKTSYPLTLAIADPDNDYRPTLVTHPAHDISDPESEIDELSSDSDDQDERPLLFETLGLPAQAPPPSNEEPPTQTPRGRKKVEIRGHMLLRSGKITGMPPPPLDPLLNLPAPPFSPTIDPTPLPNDDDTTMTPPSPPSVTNDLPTSNEIDGGIFSGHQTTSRIIDHADGTHEEVIESESDVLMHVMVPSTSPTNSPYPTTGPASAAIDRSGADATNENPILEYQEPVMEVYRKDDHGPVPLDAARLTFDQLTQTYVPFPTPPLSPAESLPDLIDLIDLSNNYPPAPVSEHQADCLQYPYVHTTLNSPKLTPDRLGILDFPITDFADVMRAIENPPHRIELDALSTTATAGSTVPNTVSSPSSTSSQDMEDVEQLVTQPVDPIDIVEEAEQLVTQPVDPIDMLEDLPEEVCADACAVFPSNTPSTQSTVATIHDRMVTNHRFHLPTVTAQVESLVVTEESFVPPYAICESDRPTPYQFYAPVLEPTQAHMQLRRHFCFVLEYATLEALDRGLNTYIRHLHSSITNPNMHVYHDIYHVRSEWTGNPFMYAIERFRLTQAARYFEDTDPDHSNPTLCTLRELIDEVLSFSVHPTDWEMIARQRLAGFYGPPYSMPLHP